ncbi:MAG: hypothetical protein ACPHID_00320 [Thermoplasmatota archaeon]
MHRTLFLALLAVAFAGCTENAYENEALPPDADDTSMPADGFAPQEGRQDTGDEHVSFVGELSTGCPADERFCIYLTATNEGSSTLYVRTSQEGAFTESMKQRDSAVTKSEPMFYTQEWTVAALAPGEELETYVSWDGRLWDEDAQEYRDAPQDNYTWSVHFTYFEDADGSGSQQLSLDFPVVIGST